MKNIALYGFALFFVGAGIVHFALPSFFLMGMPEWVPFRLGIIYISGVMEILLAMGLLFRKTRRKTGLLIAVFLVLVFPVNIYMVMIPEKFDLPTYVLWLRLPLQVLFIWWALKIRKY